MTDLHWLAVFSANLKPMCSSEHSLHLLRTWEMVGKAWVLVICENAGLGHGCCFHRPQIPSLINILKRHRRLIWYSLMMSYIIYNIYKAWSCAWKAFAHDDHMDQYCTISVAVVQYGSWQIIVWQLLAGEAWEVRDPSAQNPWTSLTKLGHIEMLQAASSRYSDIASKKRKVREAGSNNLVAESCKNSWAVPQKSPQKKAGSKGKYLLDFRLSHNSVCFSFTTFVTHCQPFWKGL